MTTVSTLSTEPRRTLQLGETTFEYLVVPLGAYVDAGLLLPMGHFAQEIGLPAALRHFVQLKQKRLRYTPEDKLLTFFVSLVDGCGYTSDINTRLKPFPELARAWDLADFATQNAVNATLHTIHWPHVQQLEQLFQFLFERNSLARRQSPQEVLVVDIDTKGLPVSLRSQRFEWAERGYFPGGRNQKGLQFTAAFLGGPVREALGGYLAPGYAHVTHELPAILHLIEKRLGAPLRRRDLLQQHARLLQTEAQTGRARVLRLEQQLEQGYGHLHLVQQRLSRHQAQIKALKARCQRLPQRTRKLQRQMADHQAKVRGDRRREKNDRQRIARLGQRRQQAQEAVDLALEVSRTLLALAEAPLVLGQVRLLLVRSDSSLGTGPIITLLLERGYLFLIKGHDSRTARHLAADIPVWAWQPVDAHLRAAEAPTTHLTGCPFEVRLVVCERTAEQQPLGYYFLITNLPRCTYDTVALVGFYNGRQTIEAFNKVMGNVLFLDHLRTGSITANEGVAVLSMLAYDFQSWSAHRFFDGTPYAGIAIRELVEKGLRVLARVSWPQPGLCRTELSVESPYACAFVAGPQGSAGQLALPLDFNRPTTGPKTA